jgi:hypothetical protein
MLPYFKTDKHFSSNLSHCKRRDSSLGTALGYGLDDRGSRVRFPTGAGNFSLYRFTPRERAPGTLWLGSWVDLRAVLDAVAKRKIPSPRRESNLKTPIDQPVAHRYGSTKGGEFLDQLSDNQLIFKFLSQTFHRDHPPYSRKQNLMFYVESL